MRMRGNANGILEAHTHSVEKPTATTVRTFYKTKFMQMENVNILTIFLQNKRTNNKSFQLTHL